MRTEELDKHWSGKYYCLNCKCYTANIDNHVNHNLIFIENRKVNKMIEALNKLKKK